MAYWPLVILILMLGWCLVPVFVCHSMARRKGRDPALWAVLGFFCGWIGVAILAISGPETR